MKEIPASLVAEMPAASPIRFDRAKCLGCYACLEACQVDVFVPAERRGPGQPPLVLFPGECWYCGACVMDCPSSGAISLRHPLMNQAHWVAKAELVRGR